MAHVFGCDTGAAAQRPARSRVCRGAPRLLTAASLGLALVLGAGLGSARADDTAHARALFKEGKAHYAAKRYEAAIKAFRGAGKLRPSPLLDFNIARCHERLKRHEKAIAAYRRFAKARPKAAKKAGVAARIAALRRAAKAAARKAKRARDPYEDLEGGGDGHSYEHRGSDHGGHDHGGAAVTVVPKLGPTSPVSLGSKALSAKARRRSLAEDIHDGKSVGTGAAVRPLGSAASGPKPAPLVGAGPKPTSSKDAAKGKPARRERFASFYPKEGKRPPRPRRPAKPPRPQDEGPVYKQWWFWVAIGVGALIGGFVIAIAASGDSNTSSQGSGLRQGVGFSF